jgi:ABC-type transport system involved in multi-copper enzyme maturation permease subunit
MQLICPCATVRWLVRDTFRQARACGIFWVLLGGSALCIALCLTATVAALDGVAGRLGLAFGLLEVPFTQGPAAAVRTLELQLAGWVADAVGLLLALLWTASLLPTFLEPGAVAVLLAKPVPRWQLLVGKFGGVLTFVAFQAVVFVAGTWLALGLRTGVWDPVYFLCVPVLLLHFAIFFSFSVMLAVATRSTVACVFGSAVFWLLCWGMNFGRHAALVVPELRAMSPSFGRALEWTYWVAPKPLDFHLLLLHTFGAEDFFSGIVNVPALAAQNAWAPGLSVLSSVLCAAVLLAMTAYDFLTADY